MNQGCLVAESLHKSSGTGGLPKLLKYWSYIDIWPFYDKVKFASVCICVDPIHLYGKMLIISNDLSSEASWPVLLKLHAEPPWAEEWKTAKMGMVHRSKWLPCPYMVKIFKKSSSPEPNKPWALIFAQIMGDRFFFFFFWFGFYSPFQNISLISSRSFIKGGRKPENPEKNHLTIRKQNLAFPHVTWAKLERQRWET